MSKLFTLTFLLFQTSILFAQSSVKGKITFDNNSSPVAFATVRIVGTTHASMTNEKGDYHLKNIPAGHHEIEITSLEIIKSVSKIHISKNEHFLHFKVKASEENNLEEVKIVKKVEKKQIESQGFAVSVIETKEASLRNLNTNELLDRSVGVRVRQNGGVGSRVEYNLNGMSGSTVGIFLDGIEISTYGSSFNLNNIPPAMIERIEVYKGVLPSHLTGDYVGGAINVILKKDASQNNIIASISHGSFNTTQANLSGNYRNQKTGFTVRVNGFYTYTDNNYEMWGKFSKFVHPDRTLERYYRTKRFNDSYESVGGRFEAGFTNTKWADQFFIGYNTSDTYNEIPHGTTMARPYVGRYGEYKANVLSLNYIKNNLLTKGLSLNVNAVQSYRSTFISDTVGQVYNWDGKPRMIIRNGVEIPIPPVPGMGQQGVKSISKINREVTNMRSNLSYSIFRGHRISVNHKLEATKRDDNDLLNPVNKNLVTLSDITNNILAGNYEGTFFQTKLKTNILYKYTFNKTVQTKPQFITENGETFIKNSKKTSVDNNKGYGFTFSYMAIPNLFILGSTENSYVAAKENQLYGDPENNILENKNLTPEKNINYNLGARYSPFTTGKNRLTVYGSAFWRNGYDKISLRAVENEITQGRESDADIEVTQYTNLSRTQSKGFEAEIVYEYDKKFNALVNFSKFNSLFKQKYDDNGKIHDLYNLQLPNEPFFTLNGSLQYRFNDVIKKKSALNIYYNTGYVAPFRTVWMKSDWFTTPTQFYHDLGSSYRTPNGKMVVSLDLKNMFNAEVYDNFGVQKPGRSISVKLNYTLSKFL